MHTVISDDNVFNINSDIRAVQIDGYLAVDNITRNDAMHNSIGIVGFIDIHSIITSHSIDFNRVCCIVVDGNGVCFGGG
ncbi:hypothetical protein D3C75_468230 [compost metagenome]